MPIAPDGIKVGNPAFDVTPAKYVTGIVTENGVAYPPFELSLKKMVLGE
jgi:methylthioribose-1-phosphate isomerase